MKHLHFLPAAIIAATTLLVLPVAANAAATLTQAQLTLIIKDVKTIDPGKGARPAVIKETVQGSQGVRTGIDSRTELLFNDKTITRLGSNTHFSFSEGTRDMSLQSGVMLLQVPKGIGGAKIETPAVTAGITGTTIMLFSGIKYTKYIVLEGHGFLVVKLKGGKLSGRLWVKAGQEIVVLNSTGQVTGPFFIDLKLLEKTSLLLTGRWGAHLDWIPILAAANGQKPGDFIPGNAGGIGADTTYTIGKLPQAGPRGPASSSPAAAPTTSPANTREHSIE